MSKVASSSDAVKMEQETGGERERPKTARHALQHDLSELAPFDADVDHQFSSRLHLFAFISLVCFAQMWFQIHLGAGILDSLIVAPDLGVTGLPVWLNAPYPLSVCASVFISGMLGDIYGHRNLIIGSYAAATIWLIVLGTTTNEYLYIVFRALVGFSVGFQIPACAACIAWAFGPGKLRVLCFSLYGGLAPIGFILGGLLGSLCAQYGHWHWVFRSLCIVSFFLAIEAYFVIPASFSKGKLDAPFDWLGSLFGVSGTILFLFALTHSILVGWPPFIYVLIIVSMVLLTIFLFIETRLSWPILPFSLMARPVLLAVLLCMALGWLGYAIANNNMPTLIIVLRGETQLEVTAQLTPQVFSSFISIAILNFAAPRVPAFYLFALSMVVFAVGALLLSFVEIEQSYWRFVFPGILIAALGPDLSFGSASILWSEAVPRQFQGVVSTWVNLTINVALSIGQALGGIILVSVFDDGKDLIRGIRAAEWFAASAAAAAFLLVLALRNPLSAKTSKINVSKPASRRNSTSA